ncbi:MAG: cation acetate symporter [Planctomycetaceae bacterium]|jgi:cation/acetate symporter|nr:cation acetate symporter [Planctomycetaceae bacterium]
MIYTPSSLAVIVFLFMVIGTVALSFYLGSKAKSSAGYFAAGGEIHWFVNGIAFAGDYLSAASFLGICGMVAFFGFDGFLYSIGFLAGWLVALLIIAEPLKRLGKYTFADALASKFQSSGIRSAAGFSTLIVSIVYLIPQMVGAGALVKPLLGLQYWQGVVLVGSIVVIIVVTAGMVSTTYVQFLKGGLLVIFSLVLTILVLNRGIQVAPGGPRVEPQRVTIASDGTKLIDGIPLGLKEGQKNLQPVGKVLSLSEGKQSTGPLDPIRFLTELSGAQVELSQTNKSTVNDKPVVEYAPRVVDGYEMMAPGNHPTFKGIRQQQWFPKLDFVSLMLALFAGTASLPHILIRYYTVKDQASARKSTIVGIAAIGFFYLLTLYIGFGAMVSGSMDPSDSNMAAPLLAKSFSELLFAAVSAIAFTTVLGTVSGLIVAAGGCVAHDFVAGMLGMKLSDHQLIRVAKISSIVIGALAIMAGLAFEGMNVTYLVGWAFAIAASANLPALLMLLFYRDTTKQGVIWGVLVGTISSVLWIAVCPEMFKSLYGLDPKQAWVPFSQPGIVTIPLSFIVIVIVSKLTARAHRTEANETLTS